MWAAKRVPANYRVCKAGRVPQIRICALHFWVAVAAESQWVCTQPTQLVQTGVRPADGLNEHSPVQKA